MAARIRSKVLFPLPLRPITPKNSPSAIDRLTSSSATLRS
jgi:hypothetical protein